MKKLETILDEVAMERYVEQGMGAKTPEQRKLLELVKAYAGIPVVELSDDIINDIAAAFRANGRA